MLIKHSNGVLALFVPGNITVTVLKQIRLCSNTWAWSQTSVLNFLPEVQEGTSVQTRNGKVRWGAGLAAQQERGGSGGS